LEQDYEEPSLSDPADESRAVAKVVASIESATHVREAVRACDVAALGSFFGRAWFRRVWVVQEFLLAKKVHFYTGDNEISLLQLGGAIDALFEQKEVLRARNWSTEQSIWDKYHRDLDSAKELIGSRSLIARSEGRTTRSLYQCCHMLTGRLCSDERDKVYAALGLAKNDLAIVPDYNLSLAEVCLDFAMRSLLSGDFSLLHDADTSWLESSDTSQKPSPSFLPRLHDAVSYKRPFPLGGRDTSWYGAGLSRRPAVRQSGPTTIDLRGVRVDEIRYLDTFATVVVDFSIGTGIPYKPQLFEAFERVESLYKSTPGDPSQLFSFKLAFWRTVHLGFCPRPNAVQYIDRTDFRFLNLADRTNITWSLENRAFFMTKLGFIGLGPPWLKGKDTVVVIDRAETPFLLRPATAGAGDHVWKLVGDCYLEWWMGGNHSGFQIQDARGSSHASGVVGGKRGRKLPNQDGLGGRSRLKSEFLTLC
jgi:hypothetical protein